MTHSLFGIIASAFKIAAPAVQFASLYESFQALTSIQVSHFVEWFSGQDLDSIWLKQILVGSGHTFTIQDEIDGGAKVLLGSTGAGDHASLNFNNKRHYDPADSIMIAVGKRVSTTNSTFSVGFHNVLSTLAPPEVHNSPPSIASSITPEPAPAISVSVHLLLSA